MSADAPTLDKAPVVMGGEAEWFRVFTPDPVFEGMRYGQPFKQGEAIIHRDTKLRYASAKSTQVEVNVLELLVMECDYRIEAIPDGVPPIPRYITEKQGVSS